MSKYVGDGENLCYTREDAKNYLNSKRQRDMAYGEAGNLLQYFQQQLIDNPSFLCLPNGFGRTNDKDILG